MWKDLARLTYVRVSLDNSSSTDNEMIDSRPARANDARSFAKQSSSSLESLSDLNTGDVSNTET